METYVVLLPVICVLGIAGLYLINNRREKSERNRTRVARDLDFQEKVRRLVETLILQGFTVETGRRLFAKADAAQGALQLMFTDSPCSDCDAGWRVQWCEYFLVSSFGVCARNRIALVCLYCGHVDRCERAVSVGVFGHLLVHNSNVFGVLKPDADGKSGAQKLRDFIARANSKVPVFVTPGSDSGWSEPGEN